MGQFQLFQDPEYHEWVRQWGKPVLAAIYRQDPVEGKLRLDEAQAALEECTLPEEQLEALTLSLTWFEYNLRRIGADADISEQCYLDTRAILLTRQSTDGGELQRRRLLLVLRCEGDADGIEPLGRAEVDELLRPLTRADEDHMLWHALALWAFLHGDGEIMRRAYAAQLTNPSATMGQAKWRRVHLMHRLLEGSATREDVHAAIRSQQVRPQLLEFLNHIWPRCRAAGLDDEDLRAMLAIKAKEIDAARPPVPQPERRTKTTRTPP